MLRHHLCATQDAVCETLSLAVAELGKAGISRAKVTLIELVLAEVLNNIVEHAYTGQQSGQISLRITRNGTLLWLDFCDQGHSMPAGSLPPFGAPNMDVPRADLPEGGFGWYLLHLLSLKIDYHRAGASNHLVISLDLDTLD
ncbi:hypothetical protein P775_10300 [Puniceibacterium antarcticum]|uniref:Histidine kinase/HSP90-like ATPase domain-containing protein n=1 Tax=Puniceibacterium antarcticum TaxID=1206336 RepID=A0A2G8RG03_9RHOB|nr:ATP-binding protein [Puniceibacterium antarcticum]PIL20331.1 hypothetical protein P775_10300 [Puniceibacterium antarcticum]